VARDTHSLLIVQGRCISVGIIPLGNLVSQMPMKLWHSNHSTNSHSLLSRVAAGTEHSMILTQDGRVYAAGNNQSGNLGLGHNYSSDKFLSVNASRD